MERKVRLRTTWHLDNTVEAVDAIESTTLDGDADDGESSVRGGHSGQVGGTACCGDDDLDTARSG